VSNDFFNHDNPLTRQTLARAANVNAIVAGIAAGFDKLPTEAELKQDRATYANAAAIAEVYTVTSIYPIASYVEGFHARVRIPAGQTNTGPSTINFDARGAQAIKRIDGSDMQAGDLPAGGIIELTYNGTHFVATSLLADAVAAATSASEAAASASAAATSEGNAASSASNAASSASAAASDAASLESGVLMWGGTSGGSANAQTITVDHSIAGYAAGQRVGFIAGSTNTSDAPTLNVNGLGAKTLKTRGGGTIRAKWLQAGAFYEAIDDGTDLRVRGEFRRRVVLTTSDPWSKPAGLRGLADLIVVGGGASSGGNAATSSGEAAASGAGGGAETATKAWIPASDLSASETVTIGAGGVAPGAGNNDGLDGSTSSFGSHVTAAGGTKGSGAAATSGNNAASGGAGGAGGAGGDLHIPGSDGQNGRVLSGQVTAFARGGSSHFSGSGRTGIAQVGSAGKRYGGGGAGSGSSASTAARNGAAGDAGVIIFDEVY